jgi:hypothetical protein
MGYERGLVKYSTQNAIDNHWTHKQMFRRILRPRVLIYSAVLFSLVVSLLASLWFRTPFRVDVVRDRGVLARLTDDGMLENVYRLQIMNGTEDIQHYKINAKGIDGLVIEAKDTQNKKHTKHNDDRKHNEESKDAKDSENENEIIGVNPTESRWVIVDLKIPDGSIDSGSHKIQFEIEAIESKEVVTEKSVFLVPR